MPLEARIIHRVPGRLRLKLIDKSGVAAGLERLAAQVRGLPGVIEVSANPLTGSLLILHTGPAGPLLEQAEARRLLRVVSVPPQSLHARVAAGLEESSRNLQVVTGGELDLNGLLIVALTGLAIHQALQGQFMAPAISLLWYALNAARMPPWRHEGPASQEPKRLEPKAARATTDTRKSKAAAHAAGGKTVRAAKPHGEHTVKEGSHV